MNAWTLVALSPFLLVAGLVFAPNWTIAYLCMSVGALVVFGGWCAVAKILQRAHAVVEIGESNGRDAADQTIPVDEST